MKEKNSQPEIAIQRDCSLRLKRSDGCFQSKII